MSTPNFIFFRFFSIGGESASLPLLVGYGALVGGRDLRAFIEAFWTFWANVWTGGSPDVFAFRTFRTSDQNFLKKNAFYVLTSEKYGVIYPAGKNNKKKYNHYVCYIRTDNSDTN